MPIAGVLGAVAPIVGGVIAAGAAKSAASTQAKSTDKATQNTREMFEETKANLQPFTDVGKSATYSLADLYGLPTPSNPNGGQAFNQASLDQFENSPDYQFAKQQGIKGLDASAASKGGLLSGNQLKSITDYSSGLATQNFNNYAGRLMQLANQGESAGAGQGQLSATAAGSIANSTMAGGEAQAAGIVGASNALTGGFNTGINNLIQAYGGTGQASSYGSGSFNGGMGGMGSGNVAGAGTLY